MRSRFRAWLYATLWRSRMEQEMDVELQLHMEAYADDLIRRGVPAAEAVQRAKVEFGSIARAKEACRDASGASVLESLLHDVGYGMRLLRRSPGFAAVAVFTLALGIGATTAVFSLVNAVLLRALPYGDPERLVYLYEKLPDIPNVPLEAWAPVNADFYEWQKQSRSFAAMALFTTDSLNAAMEDVTFRAAGSRVTGEFFRVLGVAPEIGRTVDNSDDQPGKGRVAVISHALWQSRFNGDRSVLGRELLLDARPYRIIGVMPPGFAFPHSSESIETIGKTTDVWVAWAMDPHSRAARNENSGNAIARVSPGVPLRQAQAEIAAITARFDPPFQQQSVKPQGVLQSFDEKIIGNSRRALLIFTGAVFLVLLIACTNVAGLSLVRASGRAQEIGVRAALGASRFRLLRQLLAETLAVATAGGMFGTALAFAIVKLVARFHPRDIPRIEEISIDARVLFFALLLSAAAVILAGLVPALAASRSHPIDALKKAGSRGVKRHTGFLDRGLMIAQVAFTVVMLVGSGLLIRSFLKLQRVDKGFHSLATVAMNIQLDRRYNGDDRQNAFFATLLERIAAVPGVEEVAAVNHLPLGGGESISLLEVEGYPFDEKVSFEERAVTPRYFAAMGIPMLNGRVFTNADAAAGPLVAVVSQSFSLRYFPGQSPVGRHVRTSGDRTIVGVVADVRQRDLDQTPPMQIYLPFSQNPSPAPDLVVRTNLPPDRVGSQVRTLVRNLDPALALSDARTMGQLVSQAAAGRRFQTAVLTAFGAIALFLSLVGLYALMSWSVQQKTGEIGVRLALGAQRSNVMRMVLREGATLWLCGMAAGLVVAWSLTRWLRSLLFEVQPTDLPTFLAVAVLFVAVATAACCLPARRATQVDPAISLRYE